MVTTGVSAAVTSLYFPGFDPQSLSVDVLGVEGDKTTYAVQKGVYTDSLDDESGFEGTGTCSRSFPAYNLILTSAS